MGLAVGVSAGLSEAVASAVGLSEGLAVGVSMGLSEAVASGVGRTGEIWTPVEAEKLFEASTARTK